MGARNQLVGACAQALSGTLFEELHYTDDAQPVSTTFMDYRLATSSEVPVIEAFLYEHGDAPGNPLGAKGVGEAGMYGVAPAVANAVAQAVGSSGDGFTELPLTPERVVARLREIRSR